MMMKILGTKPPIGAPKPTKRSVFGLLFNPHLGDSIRPIGQAFSMFVTTVAMIFAMNGLFPKNHPALKGDAEARLTMSEVLQTAYNGLSFTKAGLPKVLLFAAVASGIVLSILSIITALLYGFVSHAHAAAADGSVFVAPNPTGDLAANWLNFLFNPTESAAAIANIATTTGQTMPTTTIQTALGTALSIYSDAILIIAAIILFYHLTAMVVETAHHGQAMGKRASQIWAPIRLVVAIGLLVPVNTTSGLNSGQYIVIFIAQAGSALASNVWGGFVSTLAADSKAPPVVVAPNLINTVYDLTLMYACEYSYNFQIYQQQTSSITTSSEYVGPGGTAWTPWTQGGPPASTLSSVGKTSFTNSLQNGYDMCGSYTIPQKPVMSNPSLNTAAATAQTAIIKAFMTANASAATEANKIQSFMTADFANYDSATGAKLVATTTMPAPDDLMAIAKTYGDAVTAAISAVDISSAVSALATSSTTEGWISAGAWFNQLSSIQGEANEIVAQSLPSTVAPSFSEDGGPVTDHMAATESGHARGRFVVNTAGESVNSYQTTAKELAAFSTALKKGAPAIGAVAPPPTAGSGSACGFSDPVACMLGLVEWEASRENVWNDSATNPDGSPNSLAIGVHFSSSANPLLQMAQYGHANIHAGLQFFNYGIYALGAGLGADIAERVTRFFDLGLPTWLSGTFELIKSGGMAVAGILFFIGVVFFTIGVGLAFIVPLLPFIHFFFNTITWITCVAEAIIGIPMVALAHLNPEGEGIAGQAKGAYQMIFSVFLRPVMMVFGLISGILILYIAVGLLNALYAFAVAGAGTGAITGGSHMVVTRLMFTVVYVALIYSVANHAFGLISRLPNYTMEWLGGKGLNGEKMGDPAHINTLATAAAGYVSRDATAQLQNMGKGVQQMGSSYDSGVSANNAVRGKEEERKWKKAMLAKQGGDTGNSDANAPGVTFTGNTPGSENENG